MLGKMARSAARQPLGLPKVTAAARAASPSCQDAGKSPKIRATSGVIWGIPV